MSVSISRMFTWALALALVLVSTRDGVAKTKGADVKTLHRQGSTPLPRLLADELADAKAKRKAVVVMFTADWCQPCKMVKEMLEDSASVQRAVTRGRFLLIDVDEWRGPAHELLPGINPTQLPVLVNVDYSGKPVVSCFGTDLGLISDEAVGRNLARLLAGNSPDAKAIPEDATKRRELIVEQSKQSRERVADAPPIEVQVRAKKDLGGGQTEWKVRLFVQNHDTRRRWYAIPARVGVPLAERVQVESVQTQHLKDHVRATWMYFAADPPFWVLPVAGLGSVELDGLVVRGASDTAQIEVWELNRFEIGGKAPTFDKKVPFALSIADAKNVRPLGRPSAATEVTLVPAIRKTAPLK